MSSSEIKVINPPGAPTAAGPYSPAVLNDGLLFCSGQIALDPKSGELIGGGAADQASRCMENLQAVCAGADTDLSRALRLTIYTTAMDDFAAINEAYVSFFPGPPPARAAVGVTALPRAAAVMIDAIVAVG